MLSESPVRPPGSGDERQGIDSSAIFLGVACVGDAQNGRISTTYCHGMVVAFLSMTMSEDVEGG